MPESRVHSNPYPKFDREKILKRGQKETDAAEKQFSRDKEKIAALGLCGQIGELEEAGVMTGKRAEIQLTIPRSRSLSRSPQPR
jgi:hypothetical protein